jgi:hypothetical protein
MLANAMQKSKTPMKKPAAFGCGFFVWCGWQELNPLPLGS